MFRRAREPAMPTPRPPPPASAVEGEPDRHTGTRGASVTTTNRFQDLRDNPTPAGFPGRSRLHIQLWYIVSATLFRLSPHALFGWRRFLLRLFGAQVGVGVKLRPTAVVTYPWNVEIGDYSYIGDDTVLYSLGRIRIGRHVSISYRTFLCTGTHGYRQVEFPLIIKPILVEDEAWLAADSFVSPGVTIGTGAVVGARSTVTTDIPPGTVYAGTPARQVAMRGAAS
jgi:putative colanic acid biosynthesis acetyltransferase WcaF